MKGLRVIPFFLFFLCLSYLGVLFIHSNPTPVIVELGSQRTEPTPVGFIILTSILLGMILSGFLCSLEILLLSLQNNKLKQQLTTLKENRFSTTPVNFKEDKPRIAQKEKQNTVPE